MTKRLIGIFVVALIACAAAEKSDVVGWVVRCSGDFEDRTNAAQPTKLPCKAARDDIWYPLSRESNLALTGRKPKQWIAVRIARTGEMHRFDCDKPGECDPPPIPFAKLAPKESTAGPIQAFLETPGKAYSLVRLMLSRSANDNAARITIDYALVSDGESLTLRNLLSPTAPPGEYLLELCPFDAENGCPTPHKPVSLKWTPESPVPWPQPVKAGLYEIVISKLVNDVSMRTPDRGLLLVAPKQNEITVRAQVRAGEELFLHDWKSKSDGRLMFQALLVDLALRGF